MMTPATAAIVLASLQTARSIAEWAKSQVQLANQQGSYTPEQKEAIASEAATLDGQVETIVEEALARRNATGTTPSDGG